MSEKVDVTWIEQLGLKRDDIGANVAVAVSGSGFSAGAKTMAGRLGIELRTVESITVEDVVGWASFRRESNMSSSDGHSKSGLTAALRQEHVEIPAPAPSQHRISKTTIGE